eukprot:1159359-Pelagomonas_calceolata.AAC.5
MERKAGGGIGAALPASDRAEAASTIASAPSVYPLPPLTCPPFPSHFYMFVSIKLLPLLPLHR